MYDLILPMRKDCLVEKLKLASWLSCISVLVGLPCFAQPSSLSPQIMSSQQQVKWTTGPATGSLGDVAEMEIPEGYRLTDAAGARVLLQRMKNPVPAGLVGILMPESGGWWAVLEYADTGYVRPASARRIDAATILKGMTAKVEAQNTLRARQGMAPVKSLDWELAPQYDETNNTLSCAIRIEAPTEVIVNQSIRLFGRRGVLLATSVQKVKGSAESLPLKELLSHVMFKTGQRYEEYQEGDKVANVDAYQLLTGEEQIIASVKKGWAAFFDRRTMIWIVSGLAVCVGVLVIYLVTKEIRSIKARQAFPPASSRKGEAVKTRKLRPASKEAEVAGRRRVFDYQKFYSDMMMQVSTRSYTGIPLKQAEETVEEEAGGTPAAIADAQKGAASELIARQKDFIEEQRRLMQQQTKLIEERSKLIEEKNQLLAKQSEMMENHLL